MAGAIIFLFLQNRKLKAQRSELITYAEQKATALDSLTRTGVITTMSNILERTEDELEQSPDRTLSDERITSIAALCYSLTPYADASRDSFSNKKYSPQRGQLLLMLTGMKIDSGSLQKIMIRSSFDNAFLKDADLENAYLRGANLKEAHMQDANLQNADLYEALLKDANLWGADLTNANFTGADLTNAILEWAVLNGADLQRAKLNGAEMTSAQLRNADLSGAELEWTVLTGAFLNDANFQSANLFRTKFNRANLTNANFTDANLTLADLIESDLRKATFSGSNMTGAELNGAIVSQKEWFDLLEKWKVKGAKEIREKYNLIEEDAGGQIQYRLEKI